jgi:hypothetical protein
MFDYNSMKRGTNLNQGGFMKIDKYKVMDVISKIRNFDWDGLIGFILIFAMMLVFWFITPA